MLGTEVLAPLFQGILPLSSSEFERRDPPPPNQKGSGWLNVHSPRHIRMEWGRHQEMGVGSKGREIKSRESSKVRAPNLLGPDYVTP